MTDAGGVGLIRYDSTNPNGEWTFGLGCRGVIDILLERVEGPRPAAWVDFLRGRLERHETAVLARILRTAPGDERARLGSFLVLGSDGETCHDLGSPDLAAEVASAARGALDAGRSGQVKLAGPGEGVAVVLELVEPPPTLIVCGAGPDALPLVRIAGELGWYVAVVDGRSRPATRGRFAQAAEVATLADADRLLALAGRPRAAAVVMTHNVVEDRKFLELLLETSIGYIGLLGPRNRASRILEGMGSPGPQSQARLHAPVGLDLGAETPAEIALAIVAEIRAAIAGRSGGPLRDRSEPIHDRPGTGAAVVATEAVAGRPLVHMPAMEGWRSSPTA